jgi:hypothetical protein
MKARFVVVDEYRSRDVHRVDQTKALYYAAPMNEFLDLRCDVDESPSIRNLEPKMFSERFHRVIISTNSCSAER